MLVFMGLSRVCRALPPRGPLRLDREISPVPVAPRHALGVDARDRPTDISKSNTMGLHSKYSLVVVLIAVSQIGFVQATGVGPDRRHRAPRTATVHRVPPPRTAHRASRIAHRAPRIAHRGPHAAH